MRLQCTKTLVGIVSALSLLACDEPSRVGGGDGALDGAAGAGGGGRDGGGGGPGGAGGGPGGAGGGGAGGEGGVGGAGGEGGEGGVGGAGGGAGGAGGGEAEIPDFAAVSAVGMDDRNLVVWADGPRLRVRALALDGTWAEDGVVFDTLERPIAEVATTLSSGIPWVAYATDTGAIRVRPLDDPGATPFELALFGAPRLAEAGDRVLVAGVDEAGQLGWQFVGLDDDPAFLAPPYIDDGALPAADDIARVGPAYVLRFDGPGQCLYVAGDGVPIGNFACVIAPGRFIGDGNRALITHEYVDRTDLTRRVAVTSLFGGVNRTRFQVIDAGDRSGLWMSNHRGRRPVIGPRTVRDAARGRMEMNVIGVDRLLQTEENFEEWPWPDTRAVVVEGEVAYLVRFTEPETAEITAVPLVERPRIGEFLYEIPVDDTCLATVERCNGEDEDCDGRPDNGLCCAADVLTDVELVLPEWAGEPREFLLADVENANGLRVMARIGDDHWIGWTFVRQRPVDRNENGVIDDDEIVRHRVYGSCDPTRVGDDARVECPNVGPRAYTCVESERQPGHNVCFNPEFAQANALDVRGARRGLALMTAGGYTMLLAEGPDGAPTMWWYHQLAGATDIPHVAEPLKGPVRLDCDELYAIDTADHTNEDSSMLVICSDAVLRLYPAPNVPDERYPIAGLSLQQPDHRIERADWATITRTGTDVSKVLIGYRHNGTPQVASFVFIANARRAPSSQPLLRALTDLAPADLTEPIWLHSSNAAGRPPIQITRDGQVRARLQGLDGFEWQDIITTPRPARVEYARFASRVVTSGEYAGGTGFWGVDVDGRLGLSLWAAEPSLVREAPFLDWFAVQGQYPDPLVFIEQGTGRNLRVRSQTFRCQGP